MRALRRNYSSGSILLTAIDLGIIQSITVRDRDLGHYRVDDGKHLFLISATRSGAGWTVSLKPCLLDTLRDVYEHTEARGQRSFFERAFLWIACGDECCELWPGEWATVLDLTACGSSQIIRIDRPPNCSFRVRGSGGELRHTIPLERFPTLVAAA